ncbi:M23 family metallopeptidase [Uliginosibacterium sp. H1]|uniref:M23 family metallopeptidase n=1 Tax=Uliginosibacterium sp. H1 TaxID=3114757 RepID=UPI002E17CDD5|nr:peptidoglycan DD-metalloendopeptidase family protein [Uliginosibacterium sp. H1]
MSLSAAVVAVAVPGTAPTPFQVNLLEQLPMPAIEYLDGMDQPFVREGSVERGDTLASLLARLGVQDQDLNQFVAAHPEARALLRALRPGVAVTVTTTRLGRLLSVSLPQSGADGRLLISRQAGQFVVSDQPAQLESRVRMASGEIRSSLFAATDGIGLPDSVATSLADIFGANIDFHSDLRRGDRFSVVYEMLYHQGAAVRTGRILAAEFVNDGRRYSAVWFVGADGRGEYYSADGRPLRQGFLRSPLEFSRVSSGFSMRFHPILKQWRAHRGVDYAAPTGTRIRATADGVVDFIGRQNGYGNFIVLRHQGSYTTAYAHMNGFAKGLQRGSRVSQGELIGYVGSTGWATGPHLHYEFRVNGEQKDPMRVALPQSAPLIGSQLSAFRERSAGVLAQLALAGAPQAVALRD